MIDRRYAIAALAAMALQAAAASTAVVNQLAPGFTLQDASGKPVSLVDFKGKFVVLEWVNRGCPCARVHYDSGNMPGTQKEAEAKRVVWLCVSSTSAESADDKSGADLQAWLRSKGAAPNAVLTDDQGVTGLAGGARSTQHMDIIDKQGTLTYTGATDYVEQGLAEAFSGKPISQAVTQPYGCNVKYAHG